MTKPFFDTTLLNPWRSAAASGVGGAACRFAATVAFWLAVALHAASATAQPAQFHPSSIAPEFRAGTAGSPFGWASAVADFNADGRPDVAVADRVSGRSGSTYRIEFQISGGARQFLSFASSRAALTVSAVDIDNDHDLDVVVTPILSGEVVGVWVNDGAGHFRKGKPRDVHLPPASVSTASVSGAAPPLALAMPSPRRDVAMQAAGTRALADTGPILGAPVASSGFPQQFLASALALRGPPAHV